MGRLASGHATGDDSTNVQAQPQEAGSGSRVRGSLYQSLSRRQIRPCKVLQYPYSGGWTSEGGNSSSGILMTENCGIPAPPLAISFTKKRGNGHWLAVADEEGYVNIFNTNRRLPRMIDDYINTGAVRSAQWLAHTNAIFDVSWIKDDTHMLTASGDQTIKLWDVENKTGVGVMKGHIGSVKSLCAHPSESDLFVSGSRDGCVAFWDIRTPSAAQNDLDEVSYAPVAKVKDAHKGFTGKFHRRQGYTRSVTAVLYLKDERVVATAGANDGVIKYWDARKLKAPIAHTLPEGLEASSSGKNGSRLHGIAGLSQDPSGTRLIATCVDSKIYMYDVMRPEKGVLKAFSGHVMGTFYIKAAFSPDGSHILSGSSNHNAYIWKVDGIGNDPTILEGHNQEVTAVTWCPTDFCKIATCSDDYTVRVWSLTEPRFARRVCPLSTASHLTVNSEPPEAPMTPCADLQQEAATDDILSVDDDTESIATIILSLRNCNDSHQEVTPPSKRSRGLQTSSLHEESVKEDEQQSPETKMAGSPSSVLSPPGSIPRKRKTIVDYFGIQPQLSDSSPFILAHNR